MKKIATWIVLSVSLMAVLQIARAYVVSNKKFEVVYSQPVDRVGYENEPAAVRVYASPAIKWDQASKAGKVVGLIMWLLIPVVGYWIGSDKYLAGNTSRNAKEGEWKKFLIWVPVILCAVAWFASYSSSLDQGSLVRKFDEFKVEFNISDAQAAAIVKDGGHGVNIKDENGLLTDYFKGK